MKEEKELGTKADHAAKIDWHISELRKLGLDIKLLVNLKGSRNTGHAIVISPSSKSREAFRKFINNEVNKELNLDSYLTN